MLYRVSATAWLLTTSLLATSLGAIGVGFRTDTGRDLIARYAVAVLNEVVHGTAEIGEVTGNLFDGLEAHDVVIRGEDSTLLAHFPEVLLRYRALDLLSTRIAFGRVIITEPYINVVKYPNGRFNFQEVLGLGGPGGGGPALLVAFRGVEIRGGTVVIHTPTDPPDAGDTFMTEQGETGLMRVRRIDDLNATISYARISSPFPGENGLRFDIDELSARFSDPFLDISSLQGRLEIDGDSMSLDLSHFALPGSEGRFRGSFQWGRGDLMVALDIDADRWAVNDARPFASNLPWGLEGEAHMLVESLDADRIRIWLDTVRLSGPSGGGDLAGRFGILVHEGEGWTLEDTDLSFDSLAIDYLRPLVDTIPFAGRLTGRLIAHGPRDSLDVDVDFWFADSLVAGVPRTHIRGTGIMELGHDDGFAFRPFLVDTADVDLGTVQRLVPMVGLHGRLGLAGSLRGPWRDVTFSGTAWHWDDNGPMSRAIGTIRLDSRSDTVGVWAELILDSLDFAGVHPSYPRVPKRGVFGGSVSLNGYSDSLVFSADVSGPPGRIVAAGDFVLLPSTVGVRNLHAQFTRLDVAKMEPDSPETELYGALSGEVVSRAESSLFGALQIALDTSYVAGAPFDTMRAVVRFADSILYVDSARLDGPFLKMVADGGFGLAGSGWGTLRVHLDVDSLGVIESLLRDRFPMFDRDSMLTRMEGDLDLELAVTGSIDDYWVAMALTVPYAASAGALLEGLDLRTNWPSARDGPVRIDGTADSLVKGRFVFSDLALDASGARNAADWSARAGIGTEGFGVARGKMRVDSGLIAVRVDSMSLRLPSHHWLLQPGAAAYLSETGYRLDSVVFHSEDGDARVQLNGTIPRGGSPGDFSVGLVELPQRDIWGLAQLDVDDVDGTISGVIELSGTARDPVWGASLQLNDGRWGTFQAALVEATANYADRTLIGEGSLWQQGEPILSLDFELPLDLALEGSGDRQLRGPLAINAVADGVDLSFMEFVTPIVREASGRLFADVGIRGTWQQPTLTGRVSLSQAGGRFPALGVTYRDIDGELRLMGDTVFIDGLTIHSGEGLVQIDGFVRLEELTKPIFALQLEADEFRTLDVPQFLAFTTTGSLSLEGPLYGARLTGHGTVTDGDLYFADLVEKTIINLEDTLYAYLVDTIIREEGLTQAFQNRMLDSLFVDSLALELGSNVRLLSTEADIQLVGRLLIGKIGDQYRFDGTFSTPRGTYRLPFGRGFGVGELIVREFNVTGGEIQYFGTSDLNADVNIDARYVVPATRGDNITVFVNVGGTLYTPQITLTTDVVPALPDDEIISYLLFNAPTVEALGGREVGFAISQLYGALSSELERSLISDLGVPLDMLRIRPPGQGLSGTEIALGRQLGPRLFVTLSPRICQQQQGLVRNFGASLEYRFSQNWHFAASRDPANTCTLLGGPSRVLKSQFGLDLVWEKRY